mmetsp:Transcript_19482/g.36485  ORF Transcript_19482/g.36485 Transcript_19482/m.36485 type:complete len:125 (-) Transcript_19482:1141-1515(-)
MPASCSRSLHGLRLVSAAPSFSRCGRTFVFWSGCTFVFHVLALTHLRVLPPYASTQCREELVRSPPPTTVWVNVATKNWSVRIADDADCFFLTGPMQPCHLRDEWSEWEFSVCAVPTSALQALT